MFEKIKRYTVPLFFIGVFAVYFLSSVSYITDSRWTLHTSWAIIHQHNLRLDAFRPEIEQNKYYGTDNINGHLYYYFPPGTPLLCAPLLWALEQAAKRIFYFDIINLLQGPYQGGMETFLAVLFASLAAVFLWLVLRQWQINDWLARLLVFAFAFGTTAWSVASRGLFAHGPSMLFLIAGIWALNKANAKKNWLLLAGFLFGYAYVIRPTNIIPLVLFTGYVFWQFRLAGWRYLLSALIVLALFIRYNYSVYGQWLSPYFQLSHISGEHHLITGLAGTLFSPNRGLFIFSPFLILLVPALYFAFKRRVLTSLHIVIILVLVLHTLLISYIDAWYAGWCFGPRFFTDMLPYLILLLAVGLQAVLSAGITVRWMIGSLIVLTIVSCWINAQGANNKRTFDWNSIPNNIDDHRERVWDWKDMQFLR